ARPRPDRGVPRGAAADDAPGPAAELLHAARGGGRVARQARRRVRGADPRRADALAAAAAGGAGEARRRAAAQPALQRRVRADRGRAAPAGGRRARAPARARAGDTAGPAARRWDLGHLPPRPAGPRALTRRLASST